MRLNCEALETRENPATLNLAAVPPQLFQVLAADVQTLATSASRAPAAFQSFLTTSMSALADGTVSSAESSAIVQTATVVIIQAQIPIEQVVKVIFDVQVIGVAAGLSPSDVALK